MLIAGSVLTLLLMGLAVDGFLSMPGEDEDEEVSDDTLSEDAQSDKSGVTSSALSDLLFGGDDGIGDEAPGFGASTDALALGQAPGVDIAPEDSGEAGDSAEAALDAAWMEDFARADDEFDMVEIDTVTDLQDGTEVVYVETFNTVTDSLVLEFDGARADTPLIEVDLDQEEGAAIVLANGVPVGLVEGATDLTSDHVRVVMTGDETVKAFASGPVDGSPAQPDGLVAEAADNAKADLPNGVSGATGELAAEDPADLTPPQIVDPIVDVVETIDDGVPGADVINGILDQVTGELSHLGGHTDMLDARAGIDDAFGTGGSDALTGSPNDDALGGTEGQDALFGDDGNDTLSGGGGNDELHGDVGHDDLRGGEGVDFLDGGDGNDTLDGAAGRDMLFGGAGADILNGGTGDDMLHGGQGADTLNGGDGDDLLNGTFGRGNSDQDEIDALWGGDGDDTILIGQGDTAVGGAGADVFSAGDYLLDADFAGMVSDFDPAEDRIEVLYDRDLDPDPIIEVQDFSDGSGADIIMNGQVILSVTGAQGLDPNLIDLRAVA